MLLSCLPSEYSSSELQMKLLWQGVPLNAFSLGLIYSNTFEITLRHLFGQELKLGKGKHPGSHGLSRSIEESGMCTPESIQFLPSGLSWYFQQAIAMARYGTVPMA